MPSFGAVLRRPVVLAYHGVADVGDDVDPHRLVVSPRHLEAHIRYLRRLGYRFVAARDLTPPSPWPPRGPTAVLTFDDGWADGLHVALPVLKRLGVPATFFVCPGWWGAQHPDVSGGAGRLLDERGAAELVAAGMELGSHSVEHRDLRGLSDTELADDLAASKEAVENVTGGECRTFAYPYGLFGARERAAAAAAGYELAFSWQPGPWERGAVPRLPAPPRHGAARLALKLMGIRRRTH